MTQDDHQLHIFLTNWSPSSPTVNFTAPKDRWTGLWMSLDGYHGIELPFLYFPQDWFWEPTVSLMVCQTYSFVVGAIQVLRTNAMGARGKLISANEHYEGVWSNEGVGCTNCRKKHYVMFT